MKIINWYHIILNHATKVAHLLSKVTTLTKIKIKYCKNLLKYYWIIIYWTNKILIVKNEYLVKQNKYELIFQ